MKLEKLLSQRGLVTQSPEAKEVLVRAGTTSPMKIFYGETYDTKGNPIDSLKYYFFVSELASVIKKNDFDVRPMILVADVAACRNVAPELEHTYMMLGNSRADFIEKVNSVYGTDLEVIKMSDYLHTPEFQEELNRVRDICLSDQDLMERVELSVPESKIEIEREKGFAYSFDEITTIMDLDVKVGPPREDLYDNISREIASREGKKQLMSLFLTPTFPLGKNWSFFFGFEGIEDHGITAYKAGSKRLQDNRILVGRTNIEYSRELIEGSFISSNPKLPNPVLDLGIICEMARKRLENDEGEITLAEEFYGRNLNERDLKEKVANDLDKFILSKI